jgi:hypothetical protein
MSDETVPRAQAAARTGGRAIPRAGGGAPQNKAALAAAMSLDGEASRAA